MTKNPALLSQRLDGLFPAAAVVTELRDAGDATLLFDAEAAYLGRSVPKRVQEFAAGRLCARRALQEFGIENFALHVAADRQPVWPDRLIGSITHTSGFCAAVVAERKILPALGVDSEIVGHVTRDLWPTICGPTESKWLDSLPADSQEAGAALVFSAKEAFYKCQYPLVGEWLDFHDLAVEAGTWGAITGDFSVRATRAIAFAGRTTLPLSGRYRFHDEFVTAGVCLAAAALRQA